MIGKLKGIVDSYGEDHVILDVQGVGYVVQCSSRTLQRLAKPGEAAVLSIETHVREDAIHLYGFLSDHERDWFRLLQVVQGGRRAHVGLPGRRPLGEAGDEGGGQDGTRAAAHLLEPVARGRLEALGHWCAFREARGTQGSRVRRSNAAGRQELRPDG